MTERLMQRYHLICEPPKVGLLRDKSHLKTSVYMFTIHRNDGD
jgi:hypothetical protein